LWLDIAETTLADTDVLRDVFKFHPLTIEDCLSPEIHPSKIEEFEGYVFLVGHGINYAVESDVVETSEVAMYIGPNYVVTNHNFPVIATETVRERVLRNHSLLMNGDFLAHAVLDELIQDVLPTIDHMSEVIDRIEEEVLERPTTSTLAAIMRVKRSALRLQRIVVPQRETMIKISRGEFSTIDLESRIYYSNVYDLLVRIGDRVQSLRELADGALSIYFASVGFRQNETMRTLSIVAAVFLPLGLLAGVYGMNFENMPELGWKYMYFIVLGVIGTTVVTVGWSYWARRILVRRTRTAIQVWGIPAKQVFLRGGRRAATDADNVSETEINARCKSANNS